MRRISPCYPVLLHIFSGYFAWSSTPAFAHGFGFAIVFFVILGWVCGAVAGFISAFIDKFGFAQKYFGSLLVFLLWILWTAASEKDGLMQQFQAASALFMPSLLPFTIAYFVLHWIGKKLINWSKPSTKEQQHHTSPDDQKR